MRKKTKLRVLKQSIDTVKGRIGMYRLDYYDKDGKHKKIHGFKKAKDAYIYMDKHPEKEFKGCLVLHDSEYYA